MRAGQPGGRSQIFLVSFFFSFTLALAAPLHIYLTNKLEFPFSTWEVIVAVFPIFLGLLLITSCLLGLLKGVPRKLGVATVFIISMLLWVQGNLLVWNYGALDGRDIDWNALWVFGVLDGSVWVVGVALAFSRAEGLLKHVVSSLSILLVGIQCLTLSLLFANSPPLGNYRLDSRGKYKRLVLAQVPKGKRLSGRRVRPRSRIVSRPKGHLQCETRECLFIITCVARNLV